MATDAELAQALQAADAAGNVDDARQLAAALAQSRAGSTHPPAPALPLGYTRMGNPADIGRGVLQGFGDVARGVRQVGASLPTQTSPANLTGTPEEFAMTTPAKPSLAELQAEEAAIRKERATSPDRPMAAGFGRMVGAAAPAVGASFLPGGQTMLGSMAIGGAAGAAMPTVEGESRGTNAAIGAGSAGIANAAIRALAPRYAVEPEQLKLARTAQKEGIPLTGGEITDNPYLLMQERRAQFNPMISGAATATKRAQEDQFVRGLLKQVGVPEAKIAANPSLDPQTLTTARDAIQNRFQIATTGNVDFSQQPTVFRAVQNARALPMTSDDAKVVKDATQEVVNRTNAGRVSGALVQDLIGYVDESASRLSDAGAGRAAKSLRALKETLVDALPDADGYRAASGDWARLNAIETALRKSPGMAKGVPDASNLAGVLEKQMPGAVMYDRSTMADLARAGRITKSGSALPEPNMNPLTAAVYMHANNPLAKAGLLHPRSRDMAEAIMRYLPASGYQEEK